MTILPFPENSDMNLERVEERCLNYLRQSERPVASVQQLLRHCHLDEACAKLNFADLLQFLRQHHEITVLEGVDMQSGAAETEALNAAGIDLGPRAVLNTRLPTNIELMAILIQQLDDMHETLRKAEEDARGKGEQERVDQLESAVSRVTQLRQRLNNLLGREDK